MPSARRARPLPSAHRAVIVLGIIRGTFLGPIKDLEALLGSLRTDLARRAGGGHPHPPLGRFVIAGGVRAMNLAPVNPDGTPTSELQAATQRVKLLVSLELIGFLVIFTCMILMRFGL